MNPNHIDSTTTHKRIARNLVHKEKKKKSPRKGVAEKPPLVLVYSRSPKKMAVFFNLKSPPPPPPPPHQNLPTTSTPTSKSISKTQKPAQMPSIRIPHKEREICDEWEKKAEGLTLEGKRKRRGRKGRNDRCEKAE